MVNSPSRPQSFTPTSSSANKYARPRRLCTKQKEIRAGPESGSPVSRNPFTSGCRGSFPSRVQSLGDSCTHTPSILPPCTILHSSVPANDVTQLGLRSYVSGWFVPETPSTSFSFVRSDRPVYTTASIRPSGPCQPSAALAGPTFSYLGNPSPHVSGRVHIFTDDSTQGWGAHMGDSQISGTWTHTDRKLHINCLELKAVIHAPGPPGYDRYGQFDSSFIYQQARRDPFPHLATFDSRTSPLVRGSEHNNLSKAYPTLSEHDSRPPISSKSANIDRVVPSPRNREKYLMVCGTPEVDMFATVSNSHLPRFMSPILEPRALAVDTLSQDWQGRSMYMFPPFPAHQSHSEAPVHQVAEVILLAPWWPKQSWFSTPSLCGSPLCAFPTIEIFCPSRIRSMSWTESHTICMHGGSHATL